MKMTREHYNQLKANYIATRHMMSDADCDKMKETLDKIRCQLAFEATVDELKSGKTSNVRDFLITCDEVGIDLSESTQQWMLADLIEVGLKGYSCIGKIGKRKENILLKVCNELSTKI